MKTTTLLEVMAEVGKLAREIGPTMPDIGLPGQMATLGGYLAAARSRTGADRRVVLLLAAATSILLLHAHDVEAAPPAYDPGPEGA